jgi:hypothetical protein
VRPQEVGIRWGDVDVAGVDKDVLLGQTRIEVVQELDVCRRGMRRQARADSQGAPTNNSRLRSILANLRVMAAVLCHISLMPQASALMLSALP